MYAGVAEAALSASGDEETPQRFWRHWPSEAARRRSSAVSIGDAVARLLPEMMRGMEWARESATAALVLLCRRMGAQVVTQVMAVPGVEWAIWDLMSTGTDHARQSCGRPRRSAGYAYDQLAVAS